MSNPTNLTQAIDQLKREIQKETADIQQKDTAFKALVTEKQNLDTSIKTKEGEIKQKESEIVKLKTEIQQAKTKISETDRNSKKLADEVTVLKREQVTKSQSLQKIQTEFQAAVKNSAVKK